MASCDLLAIPSESEGLPFVILEAMASGLPVVATRVGQIPEIIGDNERGVLVSPRSPEELAQAIADVLAKESWLLSKKVKAYVTEFYSEQRMLDAYENVYRYWLKDSL